MWKLSDPLTETGSLNESYHENSHVLLVTKSALATKHISSCQGKLNLQLSLVYCVNIRKEQCQGQTEKR